MPDSAPAAAEPRPAASVIIVRDAPPGAAEPIEVYMVRRQRSMRSILISAEARPGLRRIIDILHGSQDVPQRYEAERTAILRVSAVVA